MSLHRTDNPGALVFRIRFGGGNPPEPIKAKTLLANTNILELVTDVPLSPARENRFILISRNYHKSPVNEYHPQMLCQGNGRRRQIVGIRNK